MSVIYGGTTFIITIIVAVLFYLFVVLPEIIYFSRKITLVTHLLAFGSFITLLSMAIIEKQLGFITLSLSFGAAFLCKGLLSRGRVRYVFFLIGIVAFIFVTVVNHRTYHFIIWIATLYSIYIVIIARFLNEYDDVEIITVKSSKSVLIQVIIATLFFMIIVGIVLLNPYYYDNTLTLHRTMRTETSISSQLLALVGIISIAALVVGFLYVLVRAKTSYWELWI